MKKIFLLLVLTLISAKAWAVAPEDYYNAGLDLLMKQHDYDKAIQYFRAAIDQRPDYWQAYQFLGESYYQASNRTEAVVAMRESLRLHPKNPALRKFMDKVMRDGPWTPDNSAKEYLSVISIILSLLTLGWTLFWSFKFRRGSRFTPPQT